MMTIIPYSLKVSKILYPFSYTEISFTLSHSSKELEYTSITVLVLKLSPLRQSFSYV